MYIVGESLVTAQVELRNTASLMSRYCNIATISGGQKYLNCVTLSIYCAYKHHGIFDILLQGNIYAILLAEFLILCCAILK